MLGADLADDPLAIPSDTTGEYALATTRAPH
jgi:hypothetical protein